MDSYDNDELLMLILDDDLFWVKKDVGILQSKPGRPLCWGLRGEGNSGGIGNLMGESLYDAGIQRVYDGGPSER